MYLLLHRALTNSGDFLIFSRARRLIETVLPGQPMTVGRAWLPLGTQFSKDELDSFKAIIICGGPGYQRHMYPGVYPLIELGAIRAPIVPLALGSKVFPGTDEQLAGFQFDATSQRCLRWLSESAPFLGARDPLTQRLLHANGISNVMMTGDPAWYDLDMINSKLRVPSRIRSIAFTPPAMFAYHLQALDLLRGIVKRWRNASISVVFHAKPQPYFEKYARRLGCRTVHIAGSADGFGIYDNVDVHIGYRVHAHLYSLSRGTITYLVTEDSRGRGVHEVLGQLGEQGFPSSYKGFMRGTTFERIRALPKFLSTDVIDSLLAQFEADSHGNYVRHEMARSVIRQHFGTMVEMIKSLP